MNYLMTKICYQMLVTIQEEAKKVPFNEFGERMKRRVDFYGTIQAKFDAIVANSEKRRKEAEEEAEDEFEDAQDGTEVQA